MSRNICYLLLSILTVLLIYGTTLSCEKPAPETTSSTLMDPLAVAEAYLDAYNKKDIDTILSIMADDIVFRQEPNGIEIKGKAKVEESIQQGFLANHKSKLETPFTVSGEKVTATVRVSGDEFRIIGLEYITVSYEAIIRDGKIYSILNTVDKNDWAEINKRTTGVVGIRIAFVKEGLKIEGFATDSPAQKAGMETGDVIVAIDGLSCADMQDWEKTLRIRGTVGSKVHLTISREGRDEPIDIEVILVQPR